MSFQGSPIYKSREGAPTQVVGMGEFPYEVMGSVLDGTMLQPQMDQIDTDGSVLPPVIVEYIDEDPYAASLVPDPIAPLSERL